MTLSETLHVLKQTYIFDEAGLERALKEVNLLEEYKKGKLHCAVCKEKVTVDNFGAFKPGTVEIVCSKLSCYYKALPK